MTRASALHSLTWLLWAVAATAALQLAPNPLYVAVVIAVSVLVVETHRGDGVFGRALGVLLVVAVCFSLLRVALIVATTHGGGNAFAHVPQATLPRLLGGFTVGGPLEWTVLWRAAAEGFVVIGVMAAFGTFNSVASHHELLQSVPRAFHEPGLVLTVALAFVPSTIASIATVREADRARTGGRVVRRGRSVRLVVPVLETGLERAVHLAESMDARGFGRGRATAAQRVSAWLGLVSLLALGGTVVALVGRATGMAAALAAAGSAALVAAVVLAPLGSGPTRYRPRRMARSDVLVLATSGAAVLGLVALSVVGESSLRWEVTGPVPFPAFHLLPAALLLLLAVPALVPRPAPRSVAARYGPDPVGALAPSRPPARAEIGAR